MLMTIALNQHNQLVHIEQVERGLSCQCTCFSCGEPVVAKKGEINEHHFAHASNKESCHLQAESILHKYAKQVIEQEKMIFLPAVPNQNSSVAQYWQFDNIIAEQSVGNIRPDLVANIGNELMFIEIAVTSFIDQEKYDFIQKLGVKTIEIDLSEFKSDDFKIPNQDVKDFILHKLDKKSWIYPKPLEINANTLDISQNQTFDKSFKYYRFTINHAWVDVRVFNSGMISVKCVNFNHEIKEMLKKWYQEGGGKYNNKYKSWNYFAPFSNTVFNRLCQLDMTPKN